MQGGAFDKNQTYILERKSVQLKHVFSLIYQQYFFIYLYLSGNLGSLYIKIYIGTGILIWQMVWHGPKGMDILVVTLG